ncbi:hypothetical protein DCCM_2987 [Desulfocucumis palustris]|uniref:Tetratricopeptide repeat protein n=1 Tax=Desulfocucumis palustris TaxID=1898651 RepID=A0A2L2XI11_9FIRM|nr:tetratricopeptide repeat protein [Desulfocucumis palustris]GBF33876.1 hypothetical protein DCCM_2987 [Desulfocucumis palustris]
MKIFGLYIILSLLTGNPILALVLLLVIFFFAERRFIGVLPDIFKPMRRANRVRQLKKVIQVNPADAEAYLELGETYFRQEKYGKAYDFLKNASKKMTGHPLYHFYLGASLYHLGNAEEGRKELEQALEINPKGSFGEPYVYLLEIYIEQKQPEELINNTYNRLLSYGSTKTFYQAGKLFLKYKDMNRARRLFRETVDNYEASRGALRKANRRWAILAKIGLLSAK